MRPRPRGLGWPLLALLATLALLLRGRGLGRSLWYDELFTLTQFARSPAEALGRQVAANNHPPASLLAWAATQLGAQEVGLRAPSADEVEVSVADTGAGIAPEDLPHIFDPFFTSKPAGEGSGLGLAVVQGIVADHGGAIDVSSEPGRGTTMSFTLPLAAGRGGAS